MLNLFRFIGLMPLLFMTVSVFAQSPIVFKEYDKSFVTYPFSDPDPIPSQGQIYPYFRYDGFTNTPVNKDWKVVELENDFIKVMILPQVGGKIWTAIEKKTGLPYIYYNHVIKFRDVAMRGPWTSGGLEPNYGIIGHTPNCATPADYVVRTNPDKSVSCFISVLDLLTRTRWQLEVNLPHDKAYFTTSSLWYNPTPLAQPYYHWMNTGIKVKGALEFIYPGNRYIGHEGEYADWPVNKENGKPINFYEQNDFGSYKSYHVFGKYTDFFGAYWHDDRYGMVRYAPQDEKAGKKIWIWGLSRQGMIWEKILTDQDGQYAEVQSGRLFNQNAEKSTFTPFKHRSFAPQATDRWTEYWYPVLRTRGMKVANAYAALNVIRENGWIKWFCSPVQSFADSILISTGGKMLIRKAVSLQPLQLLADSIRDDNDKATLSIEMPSIHLLWSSDPSFQDLQRPVEAPANFDWNSAFGLALQAKELMDQKQFAQAQDKLTAALKKDPNYLPALVSYSEWYYRNGQFAEAFAQAKKALSIDTHNGSANYYYGIAAAQLGDEVNARDGLGIASLDPEYRSAAYAELARLNIRDKDVTNAILYAQKSRDFNRYAIAPMEIIALAYRLQGNAEKARVALAELSAIQPLSPLVAMEQSFWNPGQPIAKNAFDRNELPQEVWLELACSYANRGFVTETDACLKMAGEYPLALYWRAYLLSRSGKPFDELIVQANQLSPERVFPFRTELLPVLKWAALAGNNWKPLYYLALLLKEKNQPAEAQELLTQLGEKPDFAPFYAVRALWNTDFPVKMVRDFQKAASLDPNEWRYVKLQVQYYIKQKYYPTALQLVEAYRSEHPGNLIMDMLYAKTLLLDRQFANCDALLAKLNIIPFEGATEGRSLYWEAKLMQAVDQFEQQKFPKALQFIQQAQQWPENLGVGKPYESDLDSRLENWMQYLIYQKTGKTKEAGEALDRILNFKPGIYNTVQNFQPANHLVTALAMTRQGKKSEATEWLNQQIKKYPEMNTLKWAREVFLDPQRAGDKNDEPAMRILQRLLK